MIRLYCIMLAIKLDIQSGLNAFAKQVTPVRAQLMLADQSGDLTTTISWLLGIAVIAGVGTAIYLSIIAPNLASATTKSSGLVNSIP